MQAYGTSPSSRAARAFQLVAALDRYAARLDELEAAGLGASSRLLTELTEGMRAVRVQCAPFPNLRAFYVELLIGHSELVFTVGQGPTGPARAWREHCNVLIDLQRTRAERMLRQGRQALSADRAANDAAVADFGG